MHRDPQGQESQRRVATGGYDLGFKVYDQRAGTHSRYKPATSLYLVHTLLRERMRAMKNVLAALVIGCGALQASATSGPVYSLTVTSDKPNVDPGDVVTLQLHLFGNMPLTAHKFCGTVPPNLMDGALEIRHFSVVMSNGMAVKWQYPPKTSKMSHVFYAQFAEPYFAEFQAGRNGEIPRMFGEGGLWNGPVGAEKYESPITFVFKIAERASPGVQTINFKFFYSNEHGSGLAEANTPIRVSSFGERNQNVLMGLLGVVSIVFPLTLPSVPERKRKFVWSSLGFVVVLLLWLLRI